MQSLGANRAFSRQFNLPREPHRELNSGIWNNAPNTWNLSKNYQFRKMDKNVESLPTTLDIINRSLQTIRSQSVLDTFPDFWATEPTLNRRPCGDWYVGTSYMSIEHRLIKLLNVEVVQIFQKQNLMNLRTITKEFLSVHKKLDLIPRHLQNAHLGDCEKGHCIRLQKKREECGSIWC